MAKPARQRYAVGIDLGTSNCALAYVDLREKDAPTRILDIPQWSAADRIESSRLLPSFAYYPPESIPAGTSRDSAPAGWDDRRVVGLRAREAAAREPGRVIASAKSWLAHAGVDRRARILPWGSREVPEPDKLSPVEASALYLAYLRAVWDRAMAGEDDRGALARQHVTLTVPASFDQAARQLTLEAAKLAGYPARIRLLEEPQAAFHAWLERHPEAGALQAALGAASGAPSGSAIGDAAGDTGEKEKDGRPGPPQGPSAAAGKEAGSEREPGLHGPSDAPAEAAPEAEADAPPEASARRVLVCDMGGGTTDFSLFSVAFRADGGAQIRREAVSDHILLGGDNIDLALARLLESRAGGDPLDPAAWQRLVAEARALKERALSDGVDSGRGKGEGMEAAAGVDADRTDRIFRVGISGGGGSLFEAARTAEVTEEEIGELITGGFFPPAEAGDRPRSAAGLRELGLPYAADTAVTRHLARFLSLGAPGPVDAILFNGGALTPAHLQVRLLDMVGTWQQGLAPKALENRELDLAVARGAACHGRDLALGLRPRISGGAARSYYLETAAPAPSPTIASSPSAPAAASRPEGQYLVCILPLGTETEQEQAIDKLDLRLTVNVPVEFRLYESARRPGDRAGNIVRRVPEEFRELPPLRTVARLDAARTAALGGAEIPVALHARLDAMGLLEVSLVSAHKRIQPPERWGLHFEMRAMRGTEDEGAAALPEDAMPPDRRAQASALLSSPFEPGVLRKLEEILGRRKSAWPRAWLRQLWDPLLEGLFRRDRSAAYEAAWLNAAGFLLRPGFGVVLDDYRMDQVWQVHALGPSHPRDKAVRDQYCLLWRRVAGGLSAERQLAVFSEAMPLLVNPAKPADEAAAMAAAMERAPLLDKERLLELLLQCADLRQGSPLAPLLAAIARLLSRVLLHAGEESVLPPAAVEKAFAQFRTWDWQDPRQSSLAVVFSQAARITGHRALDLPGSLRGAIVEKLRESGAQARLIRPLEEYLPVEREDLDQLYGEPLPLGLALGRFS